MMTPDIATLEEIERRVLWLSVRMIDYANRRGETEKISPAAIYSLQRRTMDSKSTCVRFGSREEDVVLSGFAGLRDISAGSPRSYAVNR